jgi:alpha-N-acetylglucosamine transferase
MATQSREPFPFKNAWVTLLTRSSYLPGVILLAHSLKTQNSKYPLLVLITKSFPESMVSALERECSLSNTHVLCIEPLTPPPENTPASLIASRFEDTWTKLRVFELWKQGFERMVFLDADMLVLKNMDELFEISLPQDWILANHVCVCNLDDDKWAPKTWRKENCAFTGLKPDDPPTVVPDQISNPGAPETHTILNGGLFVFTPFQKQWEQMMEFLSNDKRVREFLFPDQDFLAEFFRGRWQSTGWEYNALKTWRYWHENMWKDENIKNLHYIVDKPWAKRIGEDGKAGYLGNDGVTHQWWWNEYTKWEKEREGQGETEVLTVVRSEVAKPSLA